MNRIEIKDKAGNVIFYHECDGNTIAKTVEAAGFHPLDDADLSGADLRGIKVNKLNARRADFSGADLRGCEFYQPDVKDSDFSGCKLKDSVWIWADLRNAIIDLSDCSLKEGYDVRGVKSPQKKFVATRITCHPHEKAKLVSHGGGFVEMKQSAERKEKELVRRLMASASVRVSEDAAQVAELYSAAKQMEVALDAARRRLAASQASLADMQAMLDSLK